MRHRERLPHGDVTIPPAQQEDVDLTAAQLIQRDAGGILATERSLSKAIHDDGKLAQKREQLVNTAAPAVQVNRAGAQENSTLGDDKRGGGDASCGGLPVRHRRLACFLGIWGRRQCAVQAVYGPRTRGVNDTSPCCSFCRQDPAWARVHAAPLCPQVCDV